MKNQDLVEFPIYGLDMSKHLMNEHHTYKDQDLIYDLYGVVNHSGTLNFGHYTAQCFNQAEGKWFNFNDSSVSEIKQYGGYGNATQINSSSGHPTNFH